MISSFTTEFADVMQEVLKQGYPLDTSRLRDLIINISFEINIIEQHMKSVADREDVPSKWFGR